MVVIALQKEQTLKKGIDTLRPKGNVNKLKEAWIQGKKYSSQLM